jgi:hypothetical protein
MSGTFDDAFEDLLKAIRDWAEIGNPMPPKAATEKLAWLFQQFGILPDNPAAIEQQKDAQRRLEEAVSRATEHGGPGHKL